MWSTSYLRPKARFAFTIFMVPSEVLAADDKGSADASLPHGAVRACPLRVSGTPLMKSANPRRGYYLLIRRTVPNFTMASLISSQFRYGTYSQRYPFSITYTGPDPVTANLVANSRELCGHNSAIVFAFAP
ncbi:hypothetical protein BGX38DRAFT_1183482 [Terfezia claveryi]|nr:hypothetical protein BGX38DRAFT_1183482 [Terfezia claveryi]